MEREKQKKKKKKKRETEIKLVWIICYVVLGQYPNFRFFCYFLCFSSVSLTQPSTSLLYPSRMVFLRSSEIATSFAPPMATAYNSSSIATQVNVFSYTSLTYSNDHKLIKVLCFVLFFFSSFLSRNETGSGFISSNMYNYGFFSARIKLPSNYTAGLCVAFYVSKRCFLKSKICRLRFFFFKLVV